MTTVALAGNEIIDLLRERLASATFWHRRLDRVADGDATLHLAVFREPFLALLLDGTKTIESRFSVNRVAPYRTVHEGDLLLLKRASGPVVGVALADVPGFYTLDPVAWSDIRGRFAKAICAEDDEFWAERARARYATLIPIKAAVEIEPFAIDKRDRRGWVSFHSASSLERRWA